jgi:hypothetical protein
MHIGKLSARIVPGVFVLEDVVIEGLEPDHRPYLTAKTITVEFPWWSVFQRTPEAKRDLTIRSIEMTDWHMVIETWPATPEHPRGRHNLPRFRPEPRPRQEPGRFRRVVRRTHDHAAVGRRLARAPDLRGSRHPVEHHHARPPRDDGQGRHRLPRHGVLRRRNHSNPGVRAVQRRDAVALHAPGHRHSLRSDRPRCRRARVRSSTGTSTWPAGPSSSIASDPALTFRRRRTSSSTVRIFARPARRISKGPSTSSRAAAS